MSQAEPRNDAGQPLVGSVLGDRYRLISLIDEGAMGRVYLGEHIHMKKRVAIKLLRRELTRVPEVLARFEREALAAAHIDHPNVATATDFGKLPDGSVYLVLEYVEGHNLRKELKHGAFSVARALRIGRQIAAALSAAHELDIVHRDLKPENVMMLDRGGDRDYVKVLDFGVAKVPIDMAQSVQDPDPKPKPKPKPDDSLITKAGMVFGTPDYMAPEQALGQSVDARADLYSLGIILYELLAGVRPFRADHELGVLGQQLSAEPPPFKLRVPYAEVPPEVERVVLALLAREPSQRPPRADLVVQRLDALLLAMGEAYEPVSSMRERMPSNPRQADFATVVQPGPALPFGGLPGRLSERVKSVLPKPMQSVPSWGVIALPIAALGLFAFLLIKFAGSANDAGAMPTEPLAETALEPTGSAPTDAASSASPEQIDSAVQAGELAVAALLERYPEQAGAHVAHARVLRKAKDIDGALSAVKKALELNPETATDSHVASVLWLAVQRRETQARAMELLKGPMQARGADIVYDLAVTDGVNKDLAKTARSWLTTRAFERVSSPEAAAAAKLFLAPTCDIRKALVKRAENVGDLRSKTLLEQFIAGKGCTANEKKPCNACLAKDDVEVAIDAIVARHPEPAAAQD